MTAREDIINAVAAAERIQKSRVSWGKDADILLELDRFRKDGITILGYIATHDDMEIVDEGG